MAFHRAAVWLIAAAAAIAVVASVPAARAVPAAATGGNIDANCMTVRAGAFARAALSFPVTDGDGGGTHLTAAQVPAAARVGDLAGDGRFGATLHGVVHWSATLTAAASAPGTFLRRVTAVIPRVTAKSLADWNYIVVTGLGGAKVDGLPLGDRYHSASGRLLRGGGDVIGEYERAFPQSAPTRRVDRTDACHSPLGWRGSHGYPQPLCRRAHFGAHASCVLRLAQHTGLLLPWGFRPCCDVLARGCRYRALGAAAN